MKNKWIALKALSAALIVALAGCDGADKRAAPDVAPGQPGQLPAW